jgi:hypothetical protein
MKKIMFVFALLGMTSTSLFSQLADVKLLQYYIGAEKNDLIAVLETRGGKYCGIVQYDWKGHDDPGSYSYTDVSYAVKFTYPSKGSATYTFSADDRCMSISEWQAYNPDSCQRLRDLMDSLYIKRDGSYFNTVKTLSMQWVVPTYNDTIFYELTIYRDKGKFSEKKGKIHISTSLWSDVAKSRKERLKREEIKQNQKKERQEEWSKRLSNATMYMNQAVSAYNNAGYNQSGGQPSASQPNSANTNPFTLTGAANTNPFSGVTGYQNTGYQNNPYRTQSGMYHQTSQFNSINLVPGNSYLEKKMWLDREKKSLKEKINAAEQRYKMASESMQTSIQFELDRLNMENNQNDMKLLDLDQMKMRGEIK